MKRYLDHMKTKSPHERRQHAMQVSAGVVALVFVAWISTIGLRFSSTPQSISDTSNDNTSQSATVLNSSPEQNTLQVATTTTYNY